VIARMSAHALRVGFITDPCEGRARREDMSASTAQGRDMGQDIGVVRQGSARAGLHDAGRQWPMNSRSCEEANAPALKAVEISDQHRYKLEPSLVSSAHAINLLLIYQARAIRRTVGCRSG